jgi:hypothetical protein
MRVKRDFLAVARKREGRARRSKPQMALPASRRLNPPSKVVATCVVLEPVGVLECFGEFGCVGSCVDRSGARVGVTHELL